MKRYLFYVAQNYSFQILRPLQTAIRARGDEVVWFFAGDEADRRYLLPGEQQLATVADVKRYRPDAVLAPGNMVPGFIPGLKVAVFHGFSVGKLNRRGEEDHFRIRGCFDLYCTQGPSTTDRFMKLARQYGYFRVVETGWPALDPLFAGELPQVENRRPVILLCSTFSRNLSCAPHIRQEVERLAGIGEWTWLVQFHPKMSPDVVASYKGIQSANLRFVETDDVLALMRQADVMVTDTSSVIVMFLLQHKPVVTVRNISPGPYLHDITEVGQLEGAIRHALTQPEPLMREIRAFADRMHPWRDGKSSERVLQAIDQALESPAGRPKPLNILRNLKARKELRYWGL